MCQLCKTKPVYEFTNKRKLCKNCFIKWFQKKVLYTIRKFGMIQRGDVIGYENKKDFRSVVLEDVLKMFAEKARVEVVKINYPPPPTSNYSLVNSRRLNNVVNRKTSLVNSKLINLKITKIAISSTTDSEAYKIINTLIKGDSKKLNEIAPVNKRIIKPLYLFLDKEVLLYAKLRRLKFRKQKIKKNDVEKFIDTLEKKHPEVKRAVVKGLLKIYD